MEGKALTNALRQNQVEDYWRDRGAKKSLSDALKSGMSEDQALDDMTGRGFGDLALGLRDKAMQRKNTALDTAEKERTIFAKLAPTIVDQPSLDTAVGYWEKITGRQVPQELRSFTPELPKRLQSMLYSTMSPAEQERARLAQNNDRRADSAEQRAQGLYPGQVAAQGAALSHAQGAEQRAQDRHPLEMQNLENKGHKLIELVGEDGFTKTKYMFDPIKNEAYPIQIAPQDGGQAPVQDQQGGKSALLQQAKDAVARGADKAAVWKRLREQHGFTDQDIWGAGL